MTSPTTKFSWTQVLVDGSSSAYSRLSNACTNMTSEESSKSELRAQNDDFTEAAEDKAQFGRIGKVPGVRYILN